MYDRLILGTVQLGMEYGINNRTGKPSASASQAILDLAYSTGIRTVDTAGAYGNSTELIGQFHRKDGRHFEIISKFILSEERSYDRFEAAVMDSLRKLDVDHYACYMFHRHHELKTNPQVGLLLHKLKEKGLLHHIGVSVYTTAELEDSIRDEMIDIIQLPFNLLDNEDQKGELIHAARKKGKKIHARSVFLQGLFFMDRNNLPVYLQPLKGYLEEIDRIAAELDETVISLAMNYVLHHPDIDGLIFGVETADQLRHNIDAVKKEPVKGLAERVRRIKVKETDLLSPVNWK